MRSRIFIAKGAQPCVNFAAPASFADDRLEFGIGGRADGHLRAVVDEDSQMLDVVHRFSAEQGMRAAGIIADHSANGAAVVGGRVGREGEFVGFGGIAQRIENDAWLNAREFALRIELKNLVHVLRKIEDDGDVAALSGEAGAGAARKNGSFEFPAGGDGGDDIVRIAGNYEADGNLAVIGAVCGIQGATAAIETHFAAHGTLKFVLQFGSLRKNVHGFCVRTERQSFELNKFPP